MTVWGAFGSFSVLPEATPFEGIGSLLISPSTAAELSGNGGLQVAGFLIQTYGTGLKHVAQYVGEANVPQDIIRLRAQVYTAMRRFGQPIIVKHMYNAEDERKGIATKSPIFQDAYGQTRTNDPFSYGTGYVSVELSEDEWIAPDGVMVRSVNQPGPEYIQAPKYRGYGPGYLTYLIEPDVREDIFKLTEVGALIRTQDAQVQAAWFPEINDNDLIVNVILDKHDNIVDARERYQAKQVQPVSIRGEDRRGYAEANTRYFSNRWVVNQQFSMSRVPTMSSPLYRVEITR